MHGSIWLSATRKSLLGLRRLWALLLTNVSAENPCWQRYVVENGSRKVIASLPIIVKWGKIWEFLETLSFYSMRTICHLDFMLQEDAISRFYVRQVEFGGRHMKAILLSTHDVTTFGFIWDDKLFPISTFLTVWRLNAGSTIWKYRSSKQNW